ncbi:hypothetical protein AM587_10017218 [Phytophthora nicotianae]|nr:hypothetical protein AM587_10017218 [Phytophthora nicotianae]
MKYRRFDGLLPNLSSIERAFVAWKVQQLATEKCTFVPTTSLQTHSRGYPLAISLKLKDATQRSTNFSMELRRIPQLPSAVVKHWFYDSANNQMNWYKSIQIRGVHQSHLLCASPEKFDQGTFALLAKAGLISTVPRGISETLHLFLATYVVRRTITSLMLGRNVCLAALIAVAVQVTAVNAATAASSICSKVEECYVNGSSSKVCDRTEKKCNRCLGEREADSMWENIGAWTEYNCYAYDDDGECPKGTTQCPATLTTSDDDEESSAGSEEAGTSEESSKSTSTSSSTKKKKSSSSSSDDSSKSSSTSTKKKKKTSSSSSDSGSDDSSSKTKKPTTKKTTKPATKSSSSSDSSSGDSSSDSTSDSSSSSGSDSSSASASNSTLQTSLESSASKDEHPKTSSVSATVAPITKSSTTTQSTTAESTSDNSKSSNTQSASSGSSGSKWGLIAGIVGGTCVLVAVAGFVVWKKKQDDEDSDDEDAAFSPNKPAANRNMSALPSASSATTAYTAQSNNYNNNYGNKYESHYDTNYSSNYSSNYGESGYSNNYTATQYAAGAGTVPVSYGSPASIDIDDDSHIRRTDSILGGTGVMSSTTSSEQTPFEFSGGPSPANQDVWGNEANSFRDKRTASNVSVEF